jgi:DNA-binding GntR family transcriptional regulator
MAAARQPAQPRPAGGAPAKPEPRGSGSGDRLSSAGERAYELIRTSIIDGTLRQGEHVREEKFAADVGVSRTPVREALRRLHAEGLVAFEAHRGARVVSWSDQAVDEIFALRAMVEGHAARWAAGRSAPETIERLTQLSDQMRAAAAGGSARLRELTTLNNEYHGLIAEAGGGPQLETLRQTLVQRPLVYRTFYWYSTPDLQRSMNHHDEIIDALAAGDGEWAAASMTAHILAARYALRNRSAPAEAGI